jgi:hypothetical protein
LHLAPEEGPSTFPTHRRRRQQTCTLHLRKSPLPVHHTDGEGNRLAPCARGKGLLPVHSTNREDDRQAPCVLCTNREGDRYAPVARRKVYYLSTAQKKKATDLRLVPGYIGPFTFPTHRRRRQRTCTLHLRQSPLPVHQTEGEGNRLLAPCT